jgi:hypothetical protein
MGDPVGKLWNVAPVALKQIAGILSHVVERRWEYRL